MSKQDKAYICFYCGKEIKSIEERHMIGVDIPYININVHRECYKKIRNEDEEKYLQKNKERIFETV